MPETLQCSECGELFELEEIQSDPVLCTSCLIDRLTPLALALAGSVMKYLGVSNPELDAASQRALIDYVYEKGQAIQAQGKPQTRTQARIKEKLKASSVYGKTAQGFKETDYRSAYPESLKEAFKQRGRESYPSTVRRSKEGLGGAEAAGADGGDKEACEGSAEGGSDKEEEGVRKAGRASGDRQGD